MVEAGQKIHACSFTWTISNLAASPQRPGKAMCSPSFHMGKTKWRLFFYPKGNHNSDYLSLFLHREASDYELTYIVLDFKLSVKSFNSHFCYMKISRNVSFQENDMLGFSEFVRGDLTNVVDRTMPFESFVICCEMSPSDGISNDFRWNQRMDFKILSQDLTRLYEEKEHQDIVLYSGHKEFYAHKAILAARWPKFMQSLYLEYGPDLPTRIDMSVIPPPVLKTVLFFLYSGKLDIPMRAITQELEAVAIKYEMVDLLQTLVTFPKVFHASTVMQFEHKFIMWEMRVLNAFNSEFFRFRRVQKFEQMYCDALVIYCQVVHDTVHGNGDYISMSFQLAGVVPDSPVSMLCTVYFIDNVTALRSGSELHVGLHVFESEAEWHQAFSVNDLRFEEDSLLQLCFEIDLCDGKSAHLFHEEDVTSPNKHPVDMDDFLHLSTDLQYLQSSSFTDFCIVCGDEVFPVHKAILSARSTVFEKMLEHDMVEKRNGSVSVSDIRPRVMKLLLVYVYSGLLGDVTHEDACDLYEAADKYAIHILKERCHFFLRKTLNVQNAQRVLDLALLHFDKRLQWAVKNYMSSESLDISDSSDDVFYI